MPSIKSPDQAALLADQALMSVAIKLDREHSCFIYRGWTGYIRSRGFKGNQHDTGMGSCLPNLLRYLSISGFYHAHQTEGCGFFSNGDYFACDLAWILNGVNVYLYMGARNGEVYVIEPNFLTKNIRTGQITEVFYNLDEFIRNLKLVNLLFYALFILMTYMTFDISQIYLDKIAQDPLVDYKFTISSVALLFLAKPFFHNNLWKLISLSLFVLVALETNWILSVEMFFCYFLEFNLIWYGLIVFKEKVKLLKRLGNLNKEGLNDGK